MELVKDYAFMNDEGDSFEQIALKIEKDAGIA